MLALHISKLKLYTGAVASNSFRVTTVFIYDDELLLSDIIREGMQYAEQEFLYEDSDIKSAKTSVNLDALQFLGQPVSLFLNSLKMRRSETFR